MSALRNNLSTQIYDQLDVIPVLVTCGRQNDLIGLIIATAVYRTGKRYNASAIVQCYLAVQNITIYAATIERLPTSSTSNSSMAAERSIEHDSDGTAQVDSNARLPLSVLRHPHCRLCSNHPSCFNLFPSARKLVRLIKHACSVRASRNISS
jgi:hypothetical protein